MFDFWRILLASFGFGLGWGISVWYKGWEPRIVSPATARVGRDVVLAFLIAPPALMIALALATNVVPAGAIEGLVN